MKKVYRVRHLRMVKFTSSFRTEKYQDKDE